MTEVVARVGRARQARMIESGLHAKRDGLSACVAMRRAAAIVSIFVALAAACGGTSSSPLPSLPNDAGGADPDAPGQTEDDAAPPADDAGVPDPVDASAPPDPVDGPATRVQCTNKLGQGLSATYGRLDGYLVSLVDPGTKTCNGDSTHLHLQIKMNGAVYDVAANMDVLYAEKVAKLPGAAWSEGWHSAITFDYAANLGAHSGDFTAYPSVAALSTKVQDALKTANHVSVYATGYGKDGVHKVHRNFGANDGAIVIEPLSPSARVLMFRFDTDPPF
jgi:hypothetical protein